MMQEQTQNQIRAELDQDSAEKLARFGEFKDPEADMRQEIDSLLMLLLSDAGEQKIVTALLVFLHRLGCQKATDMGDCLIWAAARCYHWTGNCNEAQENYVASVLQEQAAQRAAHAATVDLKPGKKMKGSVR